ncbi:formate hydrogenlyase transcriptional activator FlhA [Yersinia massiliensis]|uniref:formate hydrogenlyase transcriptional activator FlhA n=1 Tax=Yersinia massiliensis TaxID=419257 RepID=UPI0002F3EEBA|nr:formate hydrogenlyase transcriptional activator FlhA [Yersinia massiliensis]
MDSTKKLPRPTLAQVWQDTLFRVSKELLLIRDIPELVNQLRKISFSLVRFQRVNLLLLNPLYNQITLYTHDDATSTVLGTQNILFAEGPGGLAWQQQTLLQTDHPRMQREFSAVCDLAPYQALDAGCHFPLGHDNHWPGCVEFIKTDGSDFDEQAITFLGLLADVVAIAVDNISHIHRAETEREKLRFERDHYRILVDVTNTVISKLELDVLAAEVSKEIHRFFNIDYISLALCGSQDDKDKLHVFSTRYQTGKAVQHQQTWVDIAGTLAGQVLHSRELLLVDLADIALLAPEDKQLANMLDEGLQVVCLLPLFFGHKMLGVLKLAQCQRDLFTDSNLKLLRQIAARIAIAVDNALAYAEITRLKDSLVNENLYLTDQIIHNEEFGEIIGHSAGIKAVLEQVEMVAASDCTVLILGETGTGKELIARAIHNLSLRKKKRMVKMNCAAIPSGLMESDLFGHEKGAYTGAATQRIGRFEMADGGTLFLDEVGDIPLELQPKLLRVLQEREIERLGGSKIIPVDVRLIAATNRDLKLMMVNREYRSDLYYRLNVFPIVIPPLRERPEDIPLLVKFFTQKIAKRMNRIIDTIPSETLRLLSRLPWPGNIRELENVIERAVILSRGTTLNLQLQELEYHLSPLEAAKPTPEKPVRKPLLPESEEPEFSESERARIIRVLRETNGVVAGAKGAAIKLGLKRTTLLSRMQRLGISVKSIEEEESLD